MLDALVATDEAVDEMELLDELELQGVALIWPLQKYSKVAEREELVKDDD